MADAKQPEALRHAAYLRQFKSPQQHEAAAALELLQSENEQLRAGYDAARLEIASLQAQLEAVGAGGVGPLIWSAQAQPVGAAPMGIVAVSPGCVGVGWIGGYVPKHNDKLYTSPQPPAQAHGSALLQAVTDVRDWFEQQAKAVSKGCGSSYELWDLRTQRDLLDAAIAAQQVARDGT